MSTEPSHILVVDDDKRLRELLRRYLAERGFRVTVAADAAEAWARLESLAFDLIVLDVMMPGQSGFDFTEALRLKSQVPILMLTAMGEPEERIQGLERGADDYLAKPFEPRELVLRIQRILARIPAPPVLAPITKVRLGACAFDLKREELSRGGAPIKLTESEARLLRILASHAGQPVRHRVPMALVEDDGRDELQHHERGHDDEERAPEERARQISLEPRHRHLAQSGRSM